MADHGHLRHFAKVLDTTEKHWNPTPEEHMPKFYFFAETGPASKRSSTESTSPESEVWLRS